MSDNKDIYDPIAYRQAWEKWEDMEEAKFEAERSEWGDLEYHAEQCGFDWDHPENLPPKELLTEEVMLLALRGVPPHIIAKIPRELLTPTVCVCGNTGWPDGSIYAGGM